MWACENPKFVVWDERSWHPELKSPPGFSVQRGRAVIKLGALQKVLCCRFAWFAWVCLSCMQLCLLSVVCLSLSQHWFFRAYHVSVSLSTLWILCVCVVLPVVMSQSDVSVFISKYVTHLCFVYVCLCLYLDVLYWELRLVTFFMFSNIFINKYAVCDCLLAKPNNFLEFVSEQMTGK